MLLTINFLFSTTIFFKFKQILPVKIKISIEIDMFFLWKFNALKFLVENSEDLSKETKIV